MQKIKVYHFHNGSGGGVLSVIKNLLKYSTNSLIENHVIYTINKDQVQNYPVKQLEGAVSETVFYYSPKWNFYHTCRQLAKLLPDDKALLITHDWLELGMASQLGLQNPVINFLHGDFDYYYDLAKIHNKAINKFICISPVIFDKLLKSLVNRMDDILYRKFPIPSIEITEKSNHLLNCIYFVRDLTDTRKQFWMIPEINKQLIKKDISVNWIIAGGGVSKSEFKKLWNGNGIHNVEFKEAVSNESIIEELKRSDIFLLPSTAEGFPVAVVEAMKAGVVPLITNWNGATDELVIENKTGFYFNVNDVESYVDKISQLNSDRKLLQSIALTAATVANKLFNPNQNTTDIESIYFTAIESNTVIKKAKRVYGSKLDQKWIPNSITNFIRSFKK